MTKTAAQKQAQREKQAALVQDVKGFYPEQAEALEKSVSRDKALLANQEPLLQTTPSDQRVKDFFRSATLGQGLKKKKKDPLPTPQPSTSQGPAPVGQQAPPVNPLNPGVLPFVPPTPKINWADEVDEVPEEPAEAVENEHQDEMDEAMALFEQEQNAISNLEREQIQGGFIGRMKNLVEAMRAQYDDLATGGNKEFTAKDLNAFYDAHDALLRGITEIGSYCPPLNERDISEVGPENFGVMQPQPPVTPAYVPPVINLNTGELASIMTGTLLEVQKENNQTLKARWMGNVTSLGEEFKDLKATFMTQLEDLADLGSLEEGAAFQIVMSAVRDAERSSVRTEMASAQAAMDTVLHTINTSINSIMSQNNEIKKAVVKPADPKPAQMVTEDVPPAPQPLMALYMLTNMYIKNDKGYMKIITDLHPTILENPGIFYSWMEVPCQDYETFKKLVIKLKKAYTGGIPRT